MPISVQIAARIHEHIGAGAESSNRVLGRGAQRAESLNDGSEASKLTHRKIVRKRVERCGCTPHVPERSQRATEIRAGDSAAVIAHVEHRSAFQVLESFGTKAQVTAVRQFDEWENRRDQGWVSGVETIGIKVRVRCRQSTGFRATPLNPSGVELVKTKEKLLGTRRVSNILQNERSSLGRVPRISIELRP